MPGLNPSQQDIDQFVIITQATPDQARQFLTAGVTLEGAIEDYFAAQVATDAPAPPHGDDDDLLDEFNDADDAEDAEADELDQIMSESNDQNPQGTGSAGGAGGSSGAFTLGGAAVDTSLPAGWGQPARNMLGRIGQWGAGGNQADRGGDGPRIATLGSMGAPAAPNVAGMGTSEMDELRRRMQQGNELYAGGERSGLAVQEPDRPGRGGGMPAGLAGRGGGLGMVNDILQQARNAGPAAMPEPRGSSWFGGAGNTLGSDETPSTTIPDPNAEDDDDIEEAQRHLTFWRNGFSIEDGPLYAYDAPGTSDILAAIHAGRAPPSLFNVQFNQPLQLIVAERRDEDWTPPPKGPLKPFDGGGNRLGSPVPPLSNEGSGSSTPQMPGGMPSSSAAAGPSSTSAPATAPASFAVDDSKPTTSIQVRLGDGTRLVARVNLTHTVGDLRNFVQAARADPRPFVLQTTFPNRELSDNAETIEAAKLANAVVIQRFT